MGPAGPGYDPRQFVGAAPYYLRGRPPYSALLEDVLTRELGLDGTGHLVDVGAGPGTVGVRLAASFARVTLLEPDPGMLAEARRHAGGLAHVGLVQATAEQLPDLGLPRARVVTFGQSFHRVDRPAAAAAVHDLLEPGGAMVLLTHDATRPAPGQAPPGTVPVPHDIVDELVTSFLGPQRRSGSRPAAAYSDEPFETTLARTAFAPPVVLRAPGRTDVMQDVDGVVAGVLSRSWAAPHLFGTHLDGFVTALRARLRQLSPSGRFWDWPGDTEIVVARRS